MIRSGQIWFGWVRYLLVGLLLLPNVMAIKSEKMKNTTIVFGDNIDIDYCNILFNDIPNQYWIGLRYISIRDYSQKTFLAFEGYYRFDDKLIYLFTGCNTEVMAHEFSHHRQIMKKEKYSDALTHSGNFSTYFNEIYNYIEND